MVTVVQIMKGCDEHLPGAAVVASEPSIETKTHAATEKYRRKNKTN